MATARDFPTQPHERDQEELDEQAQVDRCPAERCERTEKLLYDEALALLVTPTKSSNHILHILVRLYYVRSILSATFSKNRSAISWPPEGFAPGDEMADQPALRADIARAIGEYADEVITAMALCRKHAIAFTRLFLARTESLPPALVLKCNSDIGMANALRFVTDAEAILQPLRSITRNGLVIRECPGTAGGLEELEEKTIDKILADLGMLSALEGATLQAKRAKVRGEWIDNSFFGHIRPVPEKFMWFWGTGHQDVQDAMARVAILWQTR